MASDKMAHANGSSLVETMPRRSMPSSLPPDDFKSSLAEAASGSMLDPAPLLAPRLPATTRADEREDPQARPPLADLALPRRLCFFPILRIYWRMAATFDDSLPDAECVHVCMYLSGTSKVIKTYRRLAPKKGLHTIRGYPDM